MNPGLVRHVKIATDAWGFSDVLDALCSVAENIPYDEEEKELKEETEGFIETLAQISERWRNNPESFIFISKNRK